MRQGQNKRMRGRSRKGPNPASRTYESNGPDVKIRGTASHIADKYVTLARDAQSSGDPVAAENYFQHAEHYYRILAAAQPQFQPQQGFSRADDDRDEDGEDGDFEGDGAPGFNGAQEPPYSPQQQQRPYEGDRPQGGGSQRYDGRPRYEDQGGRDQGQGGHGQQGQPRYPRYDDQPHASQGGNGQQRDGGQQRQDQRPRYDDNRRPDDRRPPQDNRSNTYRGGEQRPRYDDRRPQGGDRQPPQGGDRDRQQPHYAERQSGGQDRQRQQPESRGEQPRPADTRPAPEPPRAEPRPEPRIEARIEAPRSFEPDPGLPAFITGPSPIVAVNGNGHDPVAEAAEPAARPAARRRRPYKSRAAADAVDGTPPAEAPAAELPLPAPAED